MKATTAHDALAHALERHRAGAFDDAERIYRAVLADLPDHPDALHLLGMLEKAKGRVPEAERLMRQALVRAGPSPHYAANLADLLRETGRYPEAWEFYQKAMEGGGGADVLNNAGLCKAAMGDRAGAERAYRESLALRPDAPATLINLAAVLIDLGRAAEAAEVAARAAASAPDLAPAHVVHSSALLASGDAAGAEAPARRAIEIDPDSPRTLTQLGLVLNAQRRFDESSPVLERARALAPRDPGPARLLAIAACERGDLALAAHAARDAAALTPDHPTTLDLAGAVLIRCGLEDESVPLLHRALRLGAGPDAHHHLGIALEHMGLPEQAEREYDEAIRRAPGHDAAHLYRAMVRLWQGDFDRGWAEYEWRLAWSARRGFTRAFPQPRWRPDMPPGTTVLLWAEQGLGDAIQFLRYAPMVAALGHRVIIECERTLAAMARGVPGVSSVVAAGDEHPPFDAQVPLMSLPLAFGTRVESVPAPIPYLQADMVLTAAWRAWFASHRARRVGLVWAGRPQHHNDANRSMRLADLEPLAGVRGVEFHSLQKGPAREQIARHVGWLSPADHADRLTDFSQTAALVECLDLVIAVDTSVAHLAGAMGKSVWLLLPQPAEWRWLRGRDDSPWYPTMTLFRQTTRGDWAPVVQRVRDALEALPGSATNPPDRTRPEPAPRSG